MPTVRRLESNMTDNKNNPYRPIAAPAKHATQGLNERRSLLKSLSTASLFMAVVLLICLLVIPEKLEEIAMMVSKMRNPTAFADYSVVYRFGIPIMLALFLFGGISRVSLFMVRQR